MSAERGSAEGQWLTWLDRITADGPSDDPSALEIWGYTGQPSYAPGDTLELHVSTTATTWGYEIWRDGAAFEKVHEATGIAGQAHPIPDDVVAAGCGWPVGATFTVPADWTSGGYIVVLRGERDGAEVTQDAFFVLRAQSPGADSKLAMIVATYSWQEYNDWGGGCGYFSDEYVDHTADPLEVREKSFKPRLSFHRPWARGLIRSPVGAPRLAQPPPPFGAAVGIPAADWAISNGYSVWTIANGWARYDALTARWLEAEGYGPELISQWDLDRDPTILDKYTTVVTTGHDEYWTAAGREVLDDFVEAGGSYARLAGNIIWQVRLEDDLRTQVCHKYAAHADPERENPDVDRRTGAFEAHYIDRPPVTTFGANGFRGVYSRMGGLSPRGPGGFIVYRPAHWAFKNADVYYGDVLGSELPLVGYESDGIDYTFRSGLPYPTGDDGTPDQLEILAITPVTLEEEDHGQAGSLLSILDGDLAFAAEAVHGEDTPEHRDKLRYGSAVITYMSKGQGEVFCAGTTEWCFALEQGHTQCEIITRNVLDQFLASLPATGVKTPRLLPYYLAQAAGLGSLASVVTLLGDIRDEFSLSETQVGLIVGIGFFTAFITQLTVGKQADNGYSPLMVRLGLVAGAASMVAFAWSSTFWAFVAARALLGAAVGLAQPAIRRTVVLADPSHIGRNIGRLGMTEMVGFAVIPAVAAVLAQAGTLDLPFYVIAAATLGLVGVMGRLEADDGARSSDNAGSLRLLRDPMVSGTLLVVTSQFIMIGAWEAVWAVSLTDLGAQTWEIGLSFTLFAIPLGLMAPLGGSWAQRTGGIHLAAGGLFASAIIGVLFGIVDSVWALVLVAVILGIGAGIGFTAGMFVYSRTVPDERQAAAQGLMGATEVLLAGVSSVLAAWLYDEWGRGAVWTVVPVLMVVTLAAGLALRSRRVPTPELIGSELP